MSMIFRCRTAFWLALQVQKFIPWAIIASITNYSYLDLNNSINTSNLLAFGDFATNSRPNCFDFWATQLRKGSVCHTTATTALHYRVVWLSIRDFHFAIVVPLPFCPRLEVTSFRSSHPFTRGILASLNGLNLVFSSV